jgi:hypothetical protein
MLILQMCCDIYVYLFVAYLLLDILVCFIHCAKRVYTRMALNAAIS